MSDRLQSYTATGGPVGIVLCHGITGSPASLRPWAEYLAARGYSVELPRLPGHGTRWQDLARTEWDDWYAAVERAFLRLGEHCSTVLAGGLSMGGALALRLAERHGDRIAGLMLVNPAVASMNRALLLLPILRRLRSSVPGIGNDIAKPGVEEGCYDRLPLAALASMLRGWRRVVANLPSVRQPLLVFRSVHDHVVDPLSLRLIRARVSATDIDQRLLVDSYHVATLDYDAPTIFAASAEFIDRLAGPILTAGSPATMTGHA